jgi:hypothetical protein
MLGNTSNMAAQHKRPEVSTKSPSEPQIKKKKNCVNRTQNLRITDTATHYLPNLSLKYLHSYYPSSTIRVLIVTYFTYVSPPVLTAFSMD